MPSTAIIGLQWGDEGKGKVIDSLAAEADVVVRYAGGNNAGHTVVVDGEKYVLHLLPGGVLHSQALNLIGRGVVVSLEHLALEVDGLETRGVAVMDRLRLDSRAHVIFPFHRHLDRLAERWKGEGRIGTTGRGIGPAYADKVSRTGIRVVDILSPRHFEKRLRAILAEKNAFISRVYGDDPEPQDLLFEESRAYAERFRDHIVDGGTLLQEAYRKGGRILFEGAQGAMLDLDAGTYPFVTSSWTGSAGIAGGTGFPGKSLDRTLAVAKAYTTRVGEGPLPTEQKGPLGDRIREAGHEYGATTGRPRRCGWFDALAARYAIDFNGVDGLILTSLDVLTGFDPVRVAVGYRRQGRMIEEYPSQLGVLDGFTVIYEDLPGWKEDITGCARFQDLPSRARDYVSFLEDRLKVPVERVSVGPGRGQWLVGRNGRMTLWPEN